MFKYLIYLIIGVVVLLLSPEAFADTSFDITLCNASNIVTGSAGKAFAAFAIISVGIGFFSGKISWGMMIGVSLGIAAIFGAPTVVSALSGGNTFQCESGSTYVLTCEGDSCYACPIGYSGLGCTSCAVGYAGANCNQCDIGYTGSSCSECTSGYNKFNGVCKLDCSVTGQNGVVDTDVASGSGSLSCTLGNHVGNLQYSCDDSNLIITSPCSCIGNYDINSGCTTCVAGYDLSSNCEDCAAGYTSSGTTCNQDCHVYGENGILDGTLALPINGSLSCVNSLGYHGLMNYHCENGLFNATTSCTPYDESPCFESANNVPITMTAPVGKVWLGVKYAIYGRTNGCVLDANPSQGCFPGQTGYYNAVNAISSSCLGQNSCNINPTNANFGGSDPCSGQPKKINVIFYY